MEMKMGAAVIYRQFGRAVAAAVRTPLRSAQKNQTR